MQMQICGCRMCFSPFFCIGTDTVHHCISYLTDITLSYTVRETLSTMQDIIKHLILGSNNNNNNKSVNNRNITRIPTSHYYFCCFMLIEIHFL